MGDSVGIPSFREHGNGHHATDLPAQPSLLAHGVHHLPEDFLFRDVIRVLEVAAPLHPLPPESVDLVRGCPAEVIAELLARFQLLTIDQKGAGDGVAVPVAVEVAEELQPAVVQGGRAVLVFPLEPRDVVVDQLGGGGVVADYDEAGRGGSPIGHPLVIGSLVVTVEGFQGGLQFHR